MVGWVLFFVFVTGTAGYFNHEITRWMQPERPLAESRDHPDQATLLHTAMERLEQVAAGAEFWSITFPYQSLTIRDWEDFTIRWSTMPLEGHEHGIDGREALDPFTGRLKPAPEIRETGAVTCSTACTMPCITSTSRSVSWVSAPC